MSENGDQNSDLHPIQREMLRIEAEFEKDAPPPGPPIDVCIAKLIDFEGDVDAELDPILAQETLRVLSLLDGHYSEFVAFTPKAVAAVGLLQGITLARAARNLQEGDG